MKNLATTAVIAVIFLIIAFTQISKRVAHQRSHQTIKAEQEAMYGPDGIPPSPGQVTPSISDDTDSQTLLDIVRNAPPPDKQGSLGNNRAIKALNILKERKDSEAFEIMLESVRNCPEDPMCLPSINILSNSWRDDRAISPLAYAASMGCVEAVKSLGSCYLPQGRDALIPLMQHTDSDIRTEAAISLSHGLRNDPAVMSAVESAMDFGTVEVAAAFWQSYLNRRYRNIIMEAFELNPFSASFNALKSKIYIHNNNSTVEETLFTIGRQDGVPAPNTIEIMRKRLERLLDDPEHYNFNP